MIPDKALESSSPKKSVACRGTKREGRKLTLTKKVVGDFLASTLAATRLSVKWRISNLNLSPHFFFSWLFCRRKKRRSRDNGLHFPSFYTVWQHLFLGLLFIISTREESERGHGQGDYGVLAPFSLSFLTAILALIESKKCRTVKVSLCIFCVEWPSGIPEQIRMDMNKIKNSFQTLETTM